MKMINMLFKELDSAKKRRVPFVIPIGTMEYHALHASIGCDTMVINGVLDQLELEKEIVVCPPIWYGVSSYAVSGPEKGTIHVNVDAYENYIYCILKSLVYGGNKNIYLVFHHQGAGTGLMPMSLACMKAAKKVSMEYCEETLGQGWWGNNLNKGYYLNRNADDIPLNYIKVIQLMDADTQKKCGGFDHAGKYETSILSALYPDCVDYARTKLNDEWFAENAKDASPELGEKMVKYALEYLNASII